LNVHNGGSGGGVKQDHVAIFDLAACDTAPVGARAGIPEGRVRGVGTGGIDGAASVTKNGDGVVSLFTDNAYTGPTTLNAGTLNINNIYALGSGLFVINGGVIDNTSGAAVTLLNNNAQTWGSDLVFGGSNDLNLGNGPVTLAASHDVSVSAGDLTVGGVISGTGPLSKSGSGTLTLSGINSYTGGTSINDGTLSLDLSARSGGISNLGAFTSGASGNLEIHSGSNAGVDSSGLDGNASFTGTGTITKTGTGYLGLFFNGSASNEGVKNFAGLIDIQEGALGNNSPGWGSGAGAMDLNIAAGALFDMRTQNVNIDALSGEGTIEKTWVPNLILTIGNNDGSATFSGIISQTIGGGSGTIALIKNGSGTQILSGPLVGPYPTSDNSFSGNIIVNGGTLIGAALRSGSNTVFGAASNARTITVNAGATLEFQVPNLFGGHWSTSAPTLIVNEGTVTNSDPWASNVINNGLSNVVLNNATLTSTAGNGVIDDIDGTNRPGEVYGAWGLNGTVTSTGTSFISTSAAGAAGRVLLGSGVDTTFAVTDGTLTVEAPLQAGDAGYLGGLIKTGAGRLVLAAANIYSSPTTVNEGTLELNGSLLAASGVTSPSNITVAPAATLSGSGSANGTLTAGGTLAPGTDGTGILSIGATTLSGTYACDIAGAAADRLAVTGNLDLTGATLAVTELTPATNTRYVIATYSGSLTGSFASVPAGYSVDATGTPNQIILVKEGGGFGTWADGFPGLTDKTPAGDPDKDGISNLL
jgi:autotransporter-associated beta strand protein